jgi:hypothetical protein
MFFLYVISYGLYFVVCTHRVISIENIFLVKFRMESITHRYGMKFGVKDHTLNASVASALAGLQVQRRGLVHQAFGESQWQCHCGRLAVPKAIGADWAGSSCFMGWTHVEDIVCRYWKRFY